VDDHALGVAGRGQRVADRVGALGAPGHDDGAVDRDPGGRGDDDPLDAGRGAQERERPVEEGAARDLDERLGPV